MFRLDFGRFLESGQRLVIEPLSCYQAGKVWTNNNTQLSYSLSLIKTTHAGKNKHYSRHRKYSVKLCTIGSKKLVAKLPIAIKHYRSAERVYNL